MKITEFAPAKINLYLKVLGKRPDGYHDIETLFERIDIFDKITAVPIGKDIAIECNDASVPTGKGSLCHKAVELLRDRLSMLRREKDNGVFVRIEKKIPVAAGLGGGSSDAASILKALNKMWGLDLGNKELMDLGGFLGADVPFFLSEASFAIGRGRGDKIETIASDKILWHLVVCPDIQMFSKEIYMIYGKESSLTLTTGMGIDTILTPIKDICEAAFLNTLLHNDLEKVIISREPLIHEIKKALSKIGNGNTLVSGSGPSVFGIYNTRKEALRAKQDCLKHFSNPKGWRIFIARTY